MNCDIIKDLLPLYADDCCSDETKAAVEDHITKCGECKKALESMRCTFDTEKTIIPAVSAENPVGLFKASLLQSALLFLSFLLLTVGVYLESSTPYGAGNGAYAFALVVPTGGFLLSLSNWFFVRQYKSRRAFAARSALVTAGVTVISVGLAILHYSNYSLPFADLQTGGEISPICFAVGATLSLIFTLVSALSANIYGKLIGKE